jgi:peptidoglycan/xylan/chitin deacetylase (PgdA/CDA1 family)
MKPVLSLPTCFSGLSLCVISIIFIAISGCDFRPDLSASTSIPKHTENLAEPPIVKDSLTTNIAADAKTIIAKKQVPVLCYHHIKDWTAKTTARAKDYIVPVNIFREQLKMLYDSGYQTILPDALYRHLVYNAPLPPKPVIISFDDTDLEQYTVAIPEMKKYGFKGVFFIMTVSLGRPNYMTREMVKEIAATGHEIGSHTWDHRNVKLYQESDWAVQIEKPTKQLEAITGKPVKYFAYPFGLWNTSAIPQLKKRGFSAAFQLATPRDQQDPLFTIRRIIVPGYWNANTLSKTMNNSFR